jgi:biotin-dependent carboxylase-like uncharacterized protein
MIEILSAGTLTSIQDEGRTGYLDYGVSHSGVLDKWSAYQAQTLVGKTLKDPILELLGNGIDIGFHDSFKISISGAAQDIMINDTQVAKNQSLEIKKGDVLSISSVGNGLASYLAIGGSWQVPKTLNSYSTHIPSGTGGINGLPLVKGDHIQIAKDTVIEVEQTAEIKESFYPTMKTIRILPGAEFPTLNPESENILFSEPFRVSVNSSRMGYRLEGNKLKADSSDIQSKTVLKGTIQLTSSGQMIALMNDAQTTGGYPRIAQIIEADLDFFAQSSSGVLVRFRKVSMDEALKLLRHYQSRF